MEKKWLKIILWFISEKFTYIFFILVFSSCSELQLEGQSHELRVRDYLPLRLLKQTQEFLFDLSLFCSIHLVRIYGYIGCSYDIGNGPFWHWRGVGSNNQYLPYYGRWPEWWALSGCVVPGMQSTDEATTVHVLPGATWTRSLWRPTCGWLERVWVAHQCHKR